MANLKKSKEMGDFGFKVKRKKHVPKHDEGLAIWMKIKDVDRLRQIADEEEVSLTGAASLVIQFWIEHHRQKKRRPVCEEEDKDNPHSSEEDPDYQAFTVKEEASTENSDTEEFTQIVEPVDESPGEDGNLVVGWKEEGDDRADEEVPSGDPVGTIQKEDISGSSADGIDGDKRVAQTSDGGEFEVVKCFIKEEPTDSDYAEENEEDAEGGFAVMPQALGGKGSNRGALSSEHHHSGPSTSRFEPDTQGEASASGMSRPSYLMNSTEKARSTQEKTGDRSHNIRDELHLQSQLGTQSESSLSHYGSTQMPNSTADFQGQSIKGEIVGPECSQPLHVETVTIRQEEVSDHQRPAAQDIGQSIWQSPSTQSDLSRIPIASNAVQSASADIDDGQRPAAQDIGHIILQGPSTQNDLLRMPIASSASQYASAGRQFQCPFCPKKLASRKGLREHIRIHTGEKPYECAICGKKFTTGNAHKTHVKTHSDAKELKCSVCSRGFNLNRSLRMHMKTHTRENLFHCEFCDKGFTQKSNLTTHMRIHTGERPYECQICSKRFNRGIQLKRHMATHTDEKNFQCEVCSMEFTLPQHLESHMEMHAKQAPFQCSVCGERFQESYQLSGHVTLHTGMKASPMSISGSQIGQSSHQRYPPVPR